MHDLMEKAMNYAVTYADNDRRVKIESEHIASGAKLAMHTCIDQNGYGCPEIEKNMKTYATERLSQYHEYVWWEKLSAEAVKSGAAPPPPPKDRTGDQHHYGCVICKGVSCLSFGR